MIIQNIKSTAILIVIMTVSISSFAQKKSIFNGKNLDGWEIYGTEKWYVENGELICESGPDKGYGYLATEKFYKDFELDLEFFLLANGNSGVFIRSTSEGTKITGLSRTPDRCSPCPCPSWRCRSGAPPSRSSRR